MRILAITAALIIGPSLAQTAEIEALITTAMKAAVDELVAPFERASAHRVRMSYGPWGGLPRRFAAGEPGDVIIVDSGVLEELITQGKVMPGRTDIARTGIGIAVRKGAPRPDVSSPEALKRALLAAKSIGHTALAGRALIGLLSGPEAIALYKIRGLML
jgi:molybdate transport system substrate-binding protein